MKRNRDHFRSTRSKWNKKLEALGLPDIPQDVAELPATFDQYLCANHPAHAEEKYGNTGGNDAENIEPEGNSSGTNLGMQHEQAARLEKLEITVEKLAGMMEKMAGRIADGAIPAAEQRRLAPPDGRDHRGKSLPDWVITDLSSDFDVNEIKNMFEKFKQYYYEHDRPLPDDNGVKIKLREWLERAAENGEQVHSHSRISAAEQQRREAIREENRRRKEEFEAHRKAVLSNPAEFAAGTAALEKILKDLAARKSFKNAEENAEN